MDRNRRNPEITPKSTQYITAARGVGIAEQPADAGNPTRTSWLKGFTKLFLTKKKQGSNF
jgi:hypothetical protein